jgi:hypothetical protein
MNISKEPPLTGHWHHGGGVLVSGTVRIAVADFDSHPFPDDLRDDIFDWICLTLNKEIDLYINSEIIKCE